MTKEEESRDTNWDYGRIERAFRIAAQTHQGTARKGSDAPYLSHVLGVADLVMTFGGTESETAAALLHDVVEDGGGADRLAEIAEECGPEVAAIVRSCSDSLEDTTADGEKAPWPERKKAYIAHLAASDVAPGAVLVSACDKLHNVTNTVVDFEEVGDVVWERFKTGWSGQVWYYRQLLRCYQASGDRRTHRVAARIASQLGRLEGLLRSADYPIDDVEGELEKATEKLTSE